MAEAPRIYPTLRYRDAEAAIRWLIGTLGFAERVVYRADGVVIHAELAFGSAILMLGEVRDDRPQQAGPAFAGRTDAIYVAVDDPDALCARVRASGAEIVTELHATDYGSREFACRDIEGNLWSFGTYWPKMDEPPPPPGGGQPA